jgi:D-alanyl-D-alanine carboxypeptidase
MSNARFSWPSRLALLFASLILVVLSGAGSANASPDFDPRKFASIVLDASTGEVLYQRDADAPRYPASLTKVMTLYLAFDALDRGDLKLTDEVTMSPRAASRPPSKLGLPAGQRLTVKEAIDVLVVKSANDVATALAERIAGSEPAFAARMTARAKALGMTHTRFRNASGLPDPNHVCTARDLAILARAFLRDHPHEYRVFDQQQTVFRGRMIPGHNALLRRPGIDGFKTGFTYASGFNLLTSGARDGHRIIAVVLGGRTSRARDRFMIDLIRASFSALVIRDAGTDVSVATLLGPENPAGQIESASAGPGVHVQKPLPASPVSSFRTAQGDEGTDNFGQTLQRWQVQVGVFSSAGRGQARLADIRLGHPAHFGAAPRRLDKIGGAYRASFAGFSAANAKEACHLLISEGDDCLMVITRQ